MAYYKKVVRWQFRIDGIHFAITRFDADEMEVEELRKNGQEDTHFYGRLESVDDRWVLEADSRKHLGEYWYYGLADQLEAYINKHGTPSTRSCAALAD